MTEQAVTVNAGLVKQLRAALELAEKGAITNGVVVGLGPSIYHRTFSVPHTQDMPAILGELGCFKAEMEFLLINNRAERTENQRSGIIGNPRRAS